MSFKPILQTSQLLHKWSHLLISINPLMYLGFILVPLKKQHCDGRWQYRLLQLWSSTIIPTSLLNVFTLATVAEGIITPSPSRQRAPPPSSCLQQHFLHTAVVVLLQAPDMCLCGVFFHLEKQPKKCCRLQNVQTAHITEFSPFFSVRSGKNIHKTCFCSVCDKQGKWWKVTYQTKGKSIRL